MNMKWHYTTSECFIRIVQDGQIVPATAGVPPGERPIVWFSMNQTWEPTANKAWRNSDGTVISLDMAKTAELGGGLVRFGVVSETAPHDWHALKELSGMSARMARGMYRAAIEQGARPGEWWGTFEAVPRRQWVAVQVYHDGMWVDVPFEASEAENAADVG